MKNIRSKIALVKQANPSLPVETAKQHSLRHAIRRVLCEATRSRVVPLVVLSLSGLITNPALGQQATVELFSLDGSNGFAINGVAEGDASGESVSAAGDVNDDGIDDLLIGAYGANASYVVFGTSGVGNGGTLELSSLNGSNGFVINGVPRGIGLSPSQRNGYSVSAVGDVNADGVDDLLIGDPLIDGPGFNGGLSAGASYVVFGASGVGSGGTVELSALDGSNGFVLNGLSENDSLGRSVSASGDVNGDGVDDLLIGASQADPNGSYSGASYVVFGASGVGSGGTVELSSLNGSNGFVLNGVTEYDHSGSSVSAAGDVNGDGVDDLIIGTYGADPNGYATGASYVVFGDRGVGNGGTVELSALDGSNGFVLNGIPASDNSSFPVGDYSGRSVSTAGDVNGDGIDDLLIGAHGADPNGDRSGASYVVFGASGVGSGGTVELSALDGRNGFVLNGVSEDDFSGRSVSAAGDANGDGIDDLLIGAVFAGFNGSSYVVFGASSVGSSGMVELSALNGANGFQLNGVAPSDFSGHSVSAAGDVNGDGIDDILIGAYGADPNGDRSGASYVVFGQVANHPVHATLVIPISTSSDDAEENTSTGKINRNSSDLELADHETHTQLVGMRFNSLNIPQGATITKAFIRFLVDEESSGTTSLIIHGQATDNAPTFTTVNANISSRSQTNAAVDWAPASWDVIGVFRGPEQTPNIASIIQEIVNRSGWSSGNSLALMISGSGQRIAESFDGDSAGAPVLHVGYSLGTGNNQAPVVDAGSEQTITLPDSANEVTLNLDGTVSDDGLPDLSAVTITWNKVSGPGTVSFGNASTEDTSANFDSAGTYVLRLTADDGTLNNSDEITVRVNPQGTPTILDVSVATGSDDAEENTITGKVKPGSSDLELGHQDQKNQLVGIRFNGLNIPQGATITDASIQFQVDEIHSGATSLMIEGEATNNALTFTNANANISSRALTGATIDWAPAPWTTEGEAGVAQQTPNIAPIIQEIVERPGWSNGNALVVIISGIGRRTAESFNGDPAGAPVLHVEYQ